MPVIRNLLTRSGSSSPAPAGRLAAPPTGVSGLSIRATGPARIGLATDASAEQLWRIVMRAEHAAGNLAGVRGAWGRCLDVVCEVAADGQPDSATSAVYRELLAR